MKQSQSQGYGQIMFAHHEKAAGSDYGYNRDDKPTRNMRHITCNDFREKGH